MVSFEAVLKRWKEYFEKLMNEENDREPRTEEAEVVNKEVNCVRRKVKNALRKMKKRKAVGPNELPVEVWKCIGEIRRNFLTRRFNKLLVGKRMPEEWRRSVLIPIYKNKWDSQFCGSCRGIKLMSHTMKVWERIIETRQGIEISKQQYGFMPGKETTDAMFALRTLMEKYREGERELHCVFVPRESLRQGFERRIVMLYEKIRNGGKVCATCSGYVRGKRNSGEACGRNYSKIWGRLVRGRRTLKTGCCGETSYVVVTTD